jgi:hypothetical protein
MERESGFWRLTAIIPFAALAENPRGLGRRTHRMASSRSACQRGATRSGLGSSGFELAVSIKHGLLTLYKVA